MDYWLVVIYSVLLSRSIPWLIVQLSDGIFIVYQIFRFVFWGSFAFAYEIAELNLIYCFLIAHVPGAVIWSCLEYWVSEGQEIGNGVEYDISIGNTQSSASALGLSISEKCSTA